MKKLMAAATATALVAISGPAAAAVTHTNKQATNFFIDSTRPCIFFKLDGVAQADPVQPASDWFALPKSHPAFAELFAILLTAKAGNRPVDVATTGGISTACSAVSTVDSITIQ